MSNEPTTLKEQVNNSVSVPVTTAVSNLHSEYAAISKRLAALPLNVSGALLGNLNNEYQLRQDEGRNAIQEHQQLAAWHKEQEAAKAQAKLEAEQAEIAAANKPKLAVVQQ